MTADPISDEAARGDEECGSAVGLPDSQEVWSVAGDTAPPPATSRLNSGRGQAEGSRESHPAGMAEPPRGASARDLAAFVVPLELQRSGYAHSGGATPRQSFADAVRADSPRIPGARSHLEEIAGQPTDGNGRRPQPYFVLRQPQKTVEEFELDKPFPSSDMSLLLKLKADITDFVSWDRVHARNVSERMSGYRIGMDTRFSAMTNLVQVWWRSCWTAAERSYSQWLVTDIIHRPEVRCQMDLPVKFDWLDHHFYQTVLRTMPSKVQSTVKEDGVNQVRRRVHELIFLLMQHAGPGIAKEKQLVWEKIRTPTQCTDPAAAVVELRSWFRAFDRLAELDMASPDVDEIYDNVVAIYERIFEDRPDGNVVWRWRKLRDEVRDEVVTAYPGLSALK